MNCIPLIILFAYQENTKFARHQWLTLIILATQEAEIRRISVQRKPGEIVRPYLKKHFTKKGWQSGSRCSL
jgi:hypothetical protein